MNQSAELKFLLGTYGNPDYLVVAQKKGVSIGVKPICGPGPKGGFIIGFRLRAAVASSDSTTSTIPQAFPKIEFEKLSSTRGSTNYVCLLPLSPFQIKEILEVASKMRYGASALKFVNDLPGVSLLSQTLEDSYVTWLDDTLSSEIKDFCGGTYQPEPDKMPEDLEFITSNALLASIEGESPDTPAPEDSPFELINGGKNDEGDFKPSSD